MKTLQLNKVNSQLRFYLAKNNTSMQKSSHTKQKTCRKTPLNFKKK